MKVPVTLLFIILMGFQLHLYGQKPRLETMLSMADTGDDDTLKVRLLTDICDSLFRSQPDKEIVYADRALKLSVKIKYERGEAYSLKYLGMGYFTKGEYVNAMNYFQKSLEKFESMNDKRGIANILSNIGVIYNNEGNDARALELYLRSLDLSEEINDSLRIVTALVNIGLIYSKKEVTRDKAETNYLKALEISEKLNYLIGTGTITVNLGELFIARGDNKRALTYFERSLDAFKKANAGNISYTLINIGKIYASEKYFQNALKYTEEALETARKNDSKLETGQALLGLASIYLQKGDTQNALKFYKQAEKITDEIGALYEKKETFTGLAKTFAKRKDYLNAYIYQQQESYLKDTLFSTTSQLQLNQLQLQYEIETMLKENEVLKRDVKLQESKNRIQLLAIGFLIIGFTVISVFTVLITRANKLRKRINAQLREKNNLISSQKQAITDSIVYARRIQKAVLPSEEFMNQLVPDHFILFKPRDVVSGDFYWFARVENRIVISVADCTGHGVPGAFMSMLGMSLLKEIVLKEYITQPDVILKKLRKEVIRSLGQKGTFGEQKDGMDISLCSVDTETLELQWAGAYNPCYIVREGKLIKLTADKMPIGFFDRMDKFTLHEMKLEKNDMIYMSTDGYPDQFGGPENKKFMSRRFTELLVSISGKPMNEQSEVLEHTLDNWRRCNNVRYEQTDDITVLGISAGFNGREKAF